eukprot:SAG31_NODE_15770_length_739_cov_1.637500_1_plen_130_part_10
MADLSPCLRWLLLLSLWESSAEFGWHKSGTSHTNASSGTPVCKVYYLDSTLGDDAAAGCAPNSAWRTLFRLRQQPLQPGSSVLFVRGGQWRGFLIGQGGSSTHGPVTYGAFGDPRRPKPALLGSVSPRSS